MERADTRRPHLEFVDAAYLEAKTGTKANTWRWWAHVGFGPPSQKIGRRRVWKLADVDQWLEDQVT